MNRLLMIINNITIYKKKILFAITFHLVDSFPLVIRMSYRDGREINYSLRI